MFQIFSILIVSSCNQISKEIMTTKLICYKLRREITEIQGFQREEMVQELDVLILQSKIRECKILACNFLAVDYTLLYAVFGVITSYTVVFLQFRSYK